MVLEDFSFGQRHELISELISSKELLTNRNVWCCGHEVKLEHWSPCSFDDDSAAAFDVVGALKYSTGCAASYPILLEVLLKTLIQQNGWLHQLYACSRVKFPPDTVEGMEKVLHEWNDGSARHQDVLDLYAEAVRYVSRMGL